MKGTQRNCWSIERRDRKDGRRYNGHEKGEGGGYSWLCHRPG